ncbi:MAG TPA: hypothetical protein VNX21_02455 [Candidatus Thermoplasmatota archaeon]|nr:hypothetical protein [Candidatus Thermoplasmatota archaeon]
MNYAKPILRTIDMNVDLAGCRPCISGYSFGGTGLCFASKTIFAADVSVAFSPSQLPVVAAPAVPGAPVAGVLALLP